MTNSEIVKAWSDAFFSGDPASSAQYLAEDFLFTGPVPEPMNREAYMGLMLTMLQAFPDLNNNMEVLGATGNTVTGTVQMAGTHNGNFDLSAMNGPVIPPTGKSFRNPKETFTCTIEGGKISRFEVEAPEGGGLPGLLAQLGVDLPA